MSLLLQDALVTTVALGAIALVARRVFGVFNPPAEAPACSNCAACPAPRQTADPDAPIPVTLVRPGHVSSSGTHARP